MLQLTKLGMIHVKHWESLDIPKALHNIWIPNFHKNRSNDTTVLDNSLLLVYIIKVIYVMIPVKVRLALLLGHLGNRLRLQNERKPFLLILFLTFSD